ncbi:MAG: arsenate reductase ArsC [Blastocatellia bacterium]|nr:arsenate reductase ArsC [Blastocatellia bacterium]
MSDTGSKKRVLFLCTGNSCRSQMAEGFLRAMAEDRFEVSSAGTHPSVVNHIAVRVMEEAGIDISHHRSKSVDEMANREFDFAITVCDNARFACPVFPASAEKLHWSFEDPAEADGTEEERLAVFRRVRDEIAGRIRHFVSSK